MGFDLFSMDIFKGSPPPPPPPEPFLSNTLLATLVSICVVFVALFVPLCIFISRRWRGWFATAADRVFENTDVDCSGTIDKKELYAGVLQVYVNMHLYGLNTRAPKRERVMSIMEKLDADDSGEINKEEFQIVMETLLKQTGGRIVTQLGITLLCPISASSVCAALKYGASLVLPLVLPAMPSVLSPSLAALVANLPSAMDETIVCGLMMMSVNPALALVDEFAEEKGAKKVSSKVIKAVPKRKATKKA
jgi:hypothetical protein